MSGKPYELTAETMGPCQVNFVKREDFLSFLKQHSDACLRVAEQLSVKYNSACREIRALGLSHSAMQKLAKLLLEWTAKDGEITKAGLASEAGVHPRADRADDQHFAGNREPVAGDLKQQRILQARGSTLLIRNKAALKALAIIQ